MSERIGTGESDKLSAVEMASIARDPATRITITESGQLALVTADGRTLEVAAADGLMAAFRGKSWVVLNHLSKNRDDLGDLVTDDNGASGVADRITALLSGKEQNATANSPSGDDGAASTSHNNNDNNDPDSSNSGEGRAVTGSFGVGFSSLSPLGGLADSKLSRVAPLTGETEQFGRDDIKRGEMGSAGQETSTATGNGIGHLTGLGDEEPGLRNGEKLNSTDNTRFTAIQTGVGSGIDHLWLLGDFEYYRAADDFLSVDDVLPNLDNGVPSYGPLLRGDWIFEGVEDNQLVDTLFDPAANIQVSGITWTMDPIMGSVVINPDGTFTYTPEDGFSGDASFTFNLTDPRTGEQIEQTVVIPVAAVADPASISGAAVTPEDTKVRIPVFVKLGDTDGSETIEQVVISGIPLGAVFGWNPNLGANVELQPNGTYIITGDTRAVQLTLRSLTLLPPDDFSGRIKLGVAVTTAETNVEPGTEIITERVTVQHDYFVDVIPVADVPDVTGDKDEVTPEDTRVLLDELAGNLNDLDGSEYLGFQISGVDPDAKLENTAGTEYAFTIAADGTKTYSITPGQIGDVYFDPPPNAFGDFEMAITAIATERANNDTAANTAPICVHVDPVADPIDIVAPDAAVDEDGTVNIGGAIGITFGDPDGSEVLTDVTVSGFPAGAIITYRDFTGTLQTINVPHDGYSISFNGGTETQIRDALASLTVQPPPHSDVNIPLNVQATMIDGGISTIVNDADFVVAVAAVADVPTLTSPAHTGVEDQDIPVPFQVGHPDTDGTEEIDTVVISNVPDGFILTGAAAGATLTDNGGGTYTVTGTSDAAINALLNTLVLDIQPGGNRDDLDTNFSLDVDVTTIENAPTTSAVPGHADNPGGEVSQLRETASFTLPVTVTPVVDLPTISGSSTMNEDGIVNVNDQSVTAAENFGADITISEDDKTDGSEAITSIVLDGFPEGAVVTWNEPDGTPRNETVPAGGLTVTLSGGTEDQIRTSLATLSIVPPLHDDADIDIGITVNKTDQTTTEPEAADTNSISATHTIVVQAVADGPSFTAAASGLEDNDIPFVITSSLIDYPADATDTSETYDFAKLTLAVGVTFDAAPLPNNIQQSVNVLGDGRTEVTFAPGVGTTTAQFEDFLATGITVRAPLDSDENFNVDVEIGTIESNPTEAGGFSLERFSRSDSVEVEITPVVDTWTITGSSSFNEDGIIDPLVDPAAVGNTAPFAFGTDIESGLNAGETAAGDTSETISEVVVTGIPNLADLNFTANPNWVIDTSTPGQVTITSPLADPNAADAAIRQALQSLTLDPTAHSDGDIALGVQVEVTDTDPDDATDTTTQTFNGTHQITVAAVADAPTGSGSGAGLEDQDIPVAISVAHPDNTDGTERIKDVVIENVPAGFILTESSALGATLTNNGGGTYTVTATGIANQGDHDAAINDLLANLTLEIDPADDSREHLDTEFNLSVTATTIESDPSVDGTPAVSEVARLENEVTFNVPITVTAVADPVTHSGQSVLVEDTAKTIGSDIVYALIDTDGTENITEVTVSGIAVGSEVKYNDVNGNPQTLNINATTDTITLAGPKTAAGEAAIRTALETLNVLAPPESDVNFQLNISATTTDNDADTNTTNWTHNVIVQAYADTPDIEADDIPTNEDTAIALTIRADRSSDGNTDNSEELSVRLTLPQDGGNPIGDIVAIDSGPFTVSTMGAVTTITGAPTGDVTITDQGNGVYLVEGPGTGNAANDEAALDAVLTGGVLTFDPRPQFSGSFTGVNGIKVEAISTESATVVDDQVYAPDDELAPNALDVGDNDTRTETVETFLDVVINPIADPATLTSAAHSGVEDTDIPVPFQVGHADDADGSETVQSVVIRNVPDGFVLTGAAAGALLTDNGGGTYTVTGSSDAAINALLNTLVLDIQPGGNRDDLDTNFSLDVDVTTIDTGVDTNTQSFVLPVTVTPVVDLPTISGSSTMNEDGIVNVNDQSVTAAENFGADIIISEDDKTDGSEAITSIVLDGFPEGAVVTWNEPDGTPRNETVPAGGLTVTLSGGTEDQIRTSLATLSIVPPLHDDADIDIGITVNKTDQTTTEPEAADTNSISATHTIVVQAVADGPSFTAAASGLEDNDIPFVITSSLIDYPADATDTSETYDFAKLTLAVGVTFDAAPLPNNIQQSVNVLGDGRTEVTFAPGVGTTTAQFEDFLANGITVRAPLDSDENFNVDVEIGTIESNPTEAGGFSLERFSASSAVEVEVTPVVDTWTITGSSSFNEDGIIDPLVDPAAVGNTAPFAFGTDIESGLNAGETAAGDTSETISEVVVTGIPNLADLNFTANPNWVIDTSTPGQVTITSPLADPNAADAAIRQALQSLTLDPTAHSDGDIALGVQVEVTDTDPDDAGDTTTQTFNGTHQITIAAVADAPTGSGSGAGLEDQTIPVSISVAHPDNTDGTERIKDVVINNVPAGFILTESSALGATLTNNGGGTYTVTATGIADQADHDAAINDLLANLALEIDPTDDSREHLDTEFNLSVTATTIESAPSVDGTPAVSEVARLENEVTFNVPITVTAVADPVTFSGQSVLVEDTAKTIGSDVVYNLIDTDGTENITEVSVSGFAVGSVVRYDDVDGNPQILNVTATTDTITLSGPKTAAGEAAIRTALDTLNVLAPPESDVNFQLNVSATTTDNDADTNTTNWTHDVIVQAYADTPGIDADDITSDEDTAVALTIRADRSSDGNTDNSETLSVRLTLPQESGNPIGDVVATATGPFTVSTMGAVTTITGAPTGNVTITDQGNGVYLIEGPGTGNAANDEAALDAVLTGGVLTFDPRPQFSGSFAGVNGIKVEAISTESATVVDDQVYAPDDELAPNALDAGDNDTRTETVETFLDVTINPILDVPTFSGNSSTIQENNNSDDPADPDLRLNLGTELGFSMADRDGSQDLDLTLNGIPDTAVVDFGGTVIATGASQVINGVTVGVVDNSDGTISITVDGVIDDGLANDAIDVLESLRLTLADDDDSDFTVGISGTSTEAISGASVLFNDTHQVTVLAAADRPTISGAGGGDEDTFIDVPITVTLNDTDGQAQGDGSETLQSVRITGIPVETGGIGEPTATPQVQFQIEGVTYDWATDTAIAITNADGSFTVNRATDGTLIFTPATAGDAGDTRAIQSALQTFTIKRGDHIGDDYSLSVQAVSVESNPTEANDNGPGVNGDQISRATATQTTTVNVDVVPVTDPIEVTAPAAVTIDEDDVRDENGDGVTGVELSDLFSGQITQHDRDGSETLTYEVTGLTGGTFSAGSYDGGTNTWSFTAAQYASAVWTPPTHGTGTFTGTLTAFTQDQPEDGTPAAIQSDSAAFSVTVKPDPDTPNASGSSTIYEDDPAGLGNEGNFGSDITYSLVDTDGSEEITQVEIDVSSLPANWVVSFNDGSTWTTSNTGGTLPTGVAYDGGSETFTITGPRAQIDAAVDTFVVAAPANSDENASVQVSVTTTDTTEDTFTALPGDDTDSDGDVDTATRTYTHNITTLAIADTPDVTANFTVRGNENDTFALVGTGGETLQADRSEDTDGVADGAGWGSEELSVVISGVPDGVVLTGTGISGTNGTFTVTAANEDQLNARIDAIMVSPGDWAGDATLTVTAITTEQGEGGGGTEIHVPTATDVDTITLEVFPVVDTPTITGNAIGDEDSFIKIPLRVDLADTDGSESLDYVDLSGLPAGASFVDASGAALGTDQGGGVWRFTPAEVDQLHISPPTNWSSQLQGDIALSAQATVTDTASTGSDTVTTFPATPITVEVQEVADKPNDFAISASATEDQPVDLGAAVLAAAGASDLTELTDNTLTDNDTSEQLSFVLRGLPAGVIPTSSTGTVTFLGGDAWSVTADAMPTLQLPADPNYSGLSPYGGAAITIEAVSQEIDGDQATSDPWVVSFEVAPVANDAADDGLTGWTPGVTVTEAKDAAAGTNVSLANIQVTAGNFIDNDGSEEVMSYTIDFTSFIGDAEVLERVRELMVDPTATPTEARDWVIANGIAGGAANYTDNADGTITISADLDGAGEITTTAESKLASLSLLATIFDDSNVDFSLGVDALVRDRADSSGGPVDVFTTESTTFDVNLVATADTPTVTAQNPDNNANIADVDTFGFSELIPLVLGGDTTDRDNIDLGRGQSEQIYYILTLDSAAGGAAPDLVLLDSGSNVVGFDNGDGTWLLTEAELADLNLLAGPFSGAPVSLGFSLTTVAVDEGSRETNTAGGQFQLIIDPGAGDVPGTPPPVPVFDTAALLGQIEDTNGPLANNANPFVTAGDGPDADTLPDPVNAISILFEVPPGVTVTGATFNPNTNRWVASADDFNNGLVSITPPADSSDPVSIDIEAVAVGTNFVTSTTGIQTLILPVTAVADAPNITAAPAGGTEDTPVDLNLNLSLTDTDGSEDLGDDVYIRLDNGATLLGGYPVVTETVDGVNLAGYYKVPVTDLAGLQIQGAADWHGTVGVEIAATSVEQSNGDVAISQTTASVSIEAEADAPVVTAPAAPIAGTEDQPVDLSGLLTAALADTETANGAEILSVKIENVPDGTLFSAGSNNGDGSWTIPTADLGTLLVTPPTNFAGTLTLTLTGISLELANGDFAQSSVDFDIEVAPVADIAALLPQNAGVESTGRAPLDLDVRLTDDRGTLPGELAPEQIEITFADVPTGVALEALSGGTVIDNGGGEFVFTGTEAQANDLALAAGPLAVAGITTVSITSAVTVDGADRNDLGFSDTFRLTVPEVLAGDDLTDDVLSGGADTQLIYGLNGTDTLSGGADADGLFGGTGADILTGGSGADTFGWEAGDLDGNVDTITDFTTGDGDALDISDLLQGFDDDTSVLSEFVQLSESGGDTTVSVDIDGGGDNYVDMATLQGVTGLDADTMKTNGNLIV